MLFLIGCLDARAHRGTLILDKVSHDNDLSIPCHLGEWKRSAAAWLFTAGAFTEAAIKAAALPTEATLNSHRDRSNGCRCKIAVRYSRVRSDAAQ